ncbi:MAG: S9 family peptidase [Acidobacteriales bacterium]|nr:S9 family peptidase [Terriglobales bacterium]
MLRRTPLIAIIFYLCASQLQAAEKPRLSIDEFFNYVDISKVELSPDGHSVVIATTRADWKQNIFRHDLWLYRDSGAQSSLIQLTQSGHDTEPQWSPDGKWIALLSERKMESKDPDSDNSHDSEDTKQLYLVSPSGGEGFPITQGEEELHSFGWSSDSRTLYFSTRQPWTKDQKEENRKKWKDTIQFRAGELGDTIFALDVSAAISRRRDLPGKPQTGKDEEDKEDVTPGARPVAATPWHVAQIAVSHDGKKLAFITTSVSERQEKIAEFEIYEVPLADASPQRPPIRLTENNAVEQDLRWSLDDKHIFFTVEVGDVSGPYRDLQPHLYWLDPETHAVTQWSKDFSGAIDSYSVTGNGVVVSGQLGTEASVYTANSPAGTLAQSDSWPGTYEHISTASHSPRVAVVYSSLEKPAEVYLADDSSLHNARKITSFNQLFTERNLPQGKPYRWTADDGTMVEGMLIYPPGKFEQKNLPLFTLIHGGPASADGNHFEADWYQWDRLAATNGWLVFEPNYRGSTGYGDKFLLGIVPQIVSRPGKDILEGVDALVRDGIADANRLAVGGYSYGGYMTNWLITQTTRFKAAVTGAGAVEHVGNWGNDDTTFDDAYFLGGLPWEAADRYHDEAAIFQINKVKTPTHMVAGADDIRVAVMEDYLLDRALHELGVPSTLLIFPGEGHSLAKNPWHGKIKVREELEWLKKYGGATQ